MNKRIISLVLALVMVLGTFTSVFAAETNKDEKKAEAPKAGDKVEKIVGKDNKIQYIIDKKFVEGYEDGSYGYDKNIKRAEITRLLVLANGHEELAKKLQGSMRIYSDVDTNHWANGVITVGTTKPSEANGIPFLVGYPDGSFQPEKDVTYAELAKMLVVLVKKDLTKEMHDNAIWASSWMTWAAELGILEDVTIADSNAPATRADAFVMMYNALYKMQAFKKVPANEKIGVLSAFNKNELVLNQDKEQTYKITDDTVFVNAGKAENSNVVKVKNIVNPDYYLGSLVRIMINDKNEVSHILELGNPREMALGQPKYTDVKNTRWKGVADYTLSTGFTDVATLDKEKTEDYNGYVKVNFNGNRTKANNINFYDAKGNFVSGVNVNSDTRVFVANPYNNIMREVKGINEALSLIGYKDYTTFEIPNVYVGYNTTDINAVYQPIKTAGYKANAKVVVFNVVTKAEGGDLYRVVRDSSYAGNLTLEDTDGKLYDRDFFKNLAYFPYNYGDFYDVIEVKYYANNNADAIETKIDHSDTKAYPIVKVIKIEDDALVIEDAFQNKTLLDIRDADIFNAKQFKKLAVGDTIQFRVKNSESNETEIISILGDMAVKGSIDGVLPYVQKEQAVGELLKVTGLDDNNTFANVEIRTYRDLFDGDLGKGTHTFVVDKDVAKTLLGHEGKEVEFKVQDNYGYAGNYKAYDFRINNVPIVDPVADAIKAYKDHVAQMVESKDVKDNYIKAVDDVKKAKELFDAIPELDQQDIEDKYTTKVENVEEAIKEAEKDMAQDALKDKIAEAEKLATRTDVTVTDDPSSLQEGDKYVSTADHTELTDAIDVAKTVAEDDSKEAQEYTEAQQTLQTAMKTYEDAIETKEA